MTEPPDRLPPPPLTGTVPSPPVRRSSTPPIALIVIVLCAVAIGILAFLYFRGPQGAATAIPNDMGGSVRTSSLDRLFDEAARRDLDALGVRVSLGQPGETPVYRIDDELRVGYSTQRPGLCVLFHRDAGGRVTVINPEKAASAAMQAGEEWVSEEMRVTEPTGSESFLAVCVPNEGDKKDAANLNDILNQNIDTWGRQLSAIRRDFEVRAR
jgi:hypothetical protein